MKKNLLIPIIILSALSAFPVQAQLDFFRVSEEMVRPLVYSVNEIKEVDDFNALAENVSKEHSLFVGYILPSDNVVETKSGSFGVVPSIQFLQVNPTRYKIKITEIKNDFVLVLNQRFHRGWEVHRSDNVNFPCPAEIQHNSFLVVECSDQVQFGFLQSISQVFSSPEPFQHFRINGFSNAWYIPSTGQQELDIVIDFGVQKYFNIGVLLSILTTACGLIYLAFGWIKSKIESAQEE